MGGLRREGGEGGFRSYSLRMRSVRVGFTGKWLGLGLLLGGMAVAAEPEPPVIILKMPYRERYGVTLGEDSVSSPFIHLYRSSTELRGRIEGFRSGIVNLTMKDDRITGTLFGAIVNVEVHQQQGMLAAEGTYGGYPVRLRFSPQIFQLQGTRCRYALTYAEGRYEGRSNCAFDREPQVQLVVPPELLRRAPTEQAALLLLALGSPMI